MSSRRRWAASSLLTLTVRRIAVARAHGNWPGRILNHRRPVPGPVPARRGRIGDDLRPVDLPARGQVRDHRGWHADPPRRTALGDRRGQPEPLIPVGSAIQRHLQHRERGLLRQAQARPDHQIAERRVASRPPAAETLPWQATWSEPADTDISPQPVSHWRHPLHPLPGRVMRIRRWALALVISTCAITWYVRARLRGDIGSRASWTVWAVTETVVAVTQCARGARLSALYQVPQAAGAILVCFIAWHRASPRSRAPTWRCSPDRPSRWAHGSSPGTWRPASSSAS